MVDGKQAKEHLTFDDKASFLSFHTYRISCIYHTAPPLSLPHPCTPLELVPILYFAYYTTFPGPPLLGTSPSHSYLKMSDKLFIYLQRIPPRACRPPPSVYRIIHT